MQDHHLRRSSNGVNNQKIRLNRSNQGPKNTLISDVKPETPIRISLTDQKTPSNQRPQISNEPISQTPKQTQSQIRPVSKSDGIRFISHTERKAY